MVSGSVFSLSAIQRTVWGICGKQQPGSREQASQPDVWDQRGREPATDIRRQANCAE